MAITVPLMTAAEVKSVQNAVWGVANGAGSVKNAVPLPLLVDVFSGSKFYKDYSQRYHLPDLDPLTRIAS